ncbi:hypothetical protein DPEC_G00150730 [Dallia pectoralis]|uniref:Uncharacterized protein n=1 Tax=Dallia pectoralis TaxID=75939 RepID=A0ACC2GJ46_DALPE|nr:hypothetical protein DPEC_G00150730 [Dallia pectoralis]
MTRYFVTAARTAMYETVKDVSPSLFFFARKIIANKFALPSAGPRKHCPPAGIGTSGHHAAFHRETVTWTTVLLRGPGTYFQVVDISVQSKSHTGLQIPLASSPERW